MNADSARNDLVRTLGTRSDREYVAGAWPEGPWGGWGWVCACRALLKPSEPIPSGVPGLLAWHDAHRVDVVLAGPLFQAVAHEAWDRGYDDGSVMHPDPTPNPYPLTGPSPLDAIRAEAAAAERKACAQMVEREKADWETSTVVPRTMAPRLATLGAAIRERATDV